MSLRNSFDLVVKAGEGHCNIYVIDVRGTVLGWRDGSRIRVYTALAGDLVGSQLQGHPIPLASTAAIYILHILSIDTHTLNYT